MCASFAFTEGSRKLRYCYHNGNVWALVALGRLCSCTLTWIKDTKVPILSDIYGRKTGSEAIKTKKEGEKNNPDFFCISRWRWFNCTGLFRTQIPYQWKRCAENVLVTGLMNGENGIKEHSVQHQFFLHFTGTKLRWERCKFARRHPTLSKNNFEAFLPLRLRSKKRAANENTERKSARKEMWIVKRTASTISSPFKSSGEK